LFHALFYAEITPLFLSYLAPFLFLLAPSLLAFSFLGLEYMFGENFLQTMP